MYINTTATPMHHYNCIGATIQSCSGAWTQCTCKNVNSWSPLTIKVLSILRIKETCHCEYKLYAIEADQTALPC